MSVFSSGNRFTAPRQRLTESFGVFNPAYLLPEFVRVLHPVGQLQHLHALAKRVGASFRNRSREFFARLVVVGD
jgi:hypothetical protein